MIAVNNAPANTPNIGFVNNKNNCEKAGTSAKPLTDEDIVSIPNIKVAKPSKIKPVSFLESFLTNIYKIIPIKASIGVNEVGFKSLIKILEPSIPPRDKIQEVIVVPILAPIITLIACLNDIRPELTKPTTITVVALED